MGRRAKWLLYDSCLAYVTCLKSTRRVTASPGNQPSLNDWQFAAKMLDRLGLMLCSCTMCTVSIFVLFKIKQGLRED